MFKFTWPVLLLSIILSALPGRADTVTLIATADAYSWGTSPCQWLNDNQLLCGNSSGEFRSFIRWDFSAIPSGSIVNSVTLRLYRECTSQTNGTGTLQVAAAAGPWNESGGQCPGPNQTGNILLFNIAGCTGSASLPFSDSNNTLRNWVQGVLAGGANNGLALRGSGNPNGYIRFRSRVNSGQEPRLVIDYTPPADLQVRNLMADRTNVAPGEMVNFSFQIRNDGGQAAGASTARQYVNPTQTCPPVGSFGQQNFSIPAIPAQQNSVPATTFSTSFANPGTHTITILADANGVVAESNESNNCASIQITVSQPSVDIIATPASQQVCPGGEATYNLSLVRRGYFGQVCLSGSPQFPGGQIVFSPQCPTGDSAVMTLRSSSSTPIFTYPVSITGSASGVTVNGMSVQFTVACGPVGVSVAAQSREVCNGEQIRLSATPSGCGPFQYNWLKNGNPVSGAPNSPQWNISPSTTNDSGVYSCRVTDVCGIAATSNTVTVSVLVPPTVTVDPSPATACPNETITLAASATGTPPITYQWLRNGSVVSTTRTLQIQVTPQTTGQYVAVATNGCATTQLPIQVSIRTCCDPDYDRDGQPDQGDVLYLISVVGGGPNPNGLDPDFNRDGNVDQDDVAALINVIAGGNCP